MSNKQIYESLRKTEAYNQAIKYLCDIGYTKSGAERKIKQYVYSDEYVNLDDFVQNHVPFMKKVKGRMRGKKFNCPRQVNTFYY